MASSSSSSSCASCASAAPAYTDYEYMSGMCGEFTTEALPGALPEPGLLTPQKCNYGLVAEQLSGTSFTTPRVFNQRVWMYRIRPASGHSKMVKRPSPLLVGDFNVHGEADPSQRRWLPFPMPESPNVTFVDGLVTYGGSGSATLKLGFAVHMYSCNASMKDSCMANSDGDFLIIPQTGVLDITTELGRIRVGPNEICVIQRCIRFSVALVDESQPARGYICELFEGHYRIPDLGPIGANGLAQPRDFRTPVAWYEDRDGIEYTLITKFAGELWESKYSWSPFNVVAWTGNYAPFKYNLANFLVVNSVSRDHLDPSIFTVLTAPTAAPGVACVDFVIFPPRWSVQEKTFRPPYFHRNVMTEFMGLIDGVYEAKESVVKQKGFFPGGATLHSCGVAHGPETTVFEKASNAELKPMRIAENSQAFMVESTYIMKLTPYAMANHVDESYHECWLGLPHSFDPQHRDPQ